jgi:hypothetical protein
MSGVKECIPSGAGVYVFSGRGRIRVDWENHANGAASMRQDVRRSRVSHVTHDASRVSLELTDTHAPLRRLRCDGGGISVVPHVTTLRTETVVVKPPGPVRSKSGGGGGSRTLKTRFF